jgi:hypothetical protein
MIQTNVKEKCRNERMDECLMKKQRLCYVWYFFRLYLISVEKKRRHDFLGFWTKMIHSHLTTKKGRPRKFLSLFFFCDQHTTTCSSCLCLINYLPSPIPKVCVPSYPLRFLFCGQKRKPYSSKTNFLYEIIILRISFVVQRGTYIIFPRGPLKVR